MGDAKGVHLRISAGGESMPHILTIPIDNPVFMNGDPLYGVAETYPSEEGHPPAVGAFDLSHTDGRPVGEIDEEVRKQILKRAYGEEEQP
jgi:hypothetical protein